MSDFEIATREVVAQPSGVNRDTDEHKQQPILTRDGPMYRRWAAHLTRAIPTRGKRNWMLANEDADFERYCESSVRHFDDWLDQVRDRYYSGESEDKEDHGAALFFNVNGAEYMVDQKEAAK